MRVLIGLALLSSLAATGVPASAKDAPVPSPLIRAVENCRAISDSAQRLACYDTSTSALIDATKSGNVSVVDRSQLRQARRSLFGFAMPKMPFFAGDRSAEDDTGELDSTIVAVRGLPYDRYRIQIKDGDAIWETTESRMNLTPPRAGEKISIKRGPLGSYFLKLNGQIGVKGRRVQ